MIEPNDSLGHRIWGYLLERFPPVAYTLLVALFTGSAFSLAASVEGSEVVVTDLVLAATVTWLVFLHLRLMDEHKDFEADRVAYPERLLSRGVVTLPTLARLGFVAVGLEALLSTMISWDAAAVWLFCFSFTVLMRYEFGLGDWLNKHLFLYAVTHNPIVGLLAAFLWVSAGGPLSTEAVAYIGIVSLGSLAFEIGRKIRLEHEEIPGAVTYSSVWGKTQADWLFVILRLFTVLVLIGFAGYRGDVWVGGVGGVLFLVAALYLKSKHRKSKVTEAVATILLLSDFLLIGVIAW